MEKLTAIHMHTSIMTDVTFRTADIIEVKLIRSDLQKVVMVTTLHNTYTISADSDEEVLDIYMTTVRKWKELLG